MAQSTPSVEDLIARVRADPKSRVFLQLAEAYRRAGQVEQALAILERGLEHQPMYLAARVAQGRCLLELGDLEEAQETLEGVLQRDATQLVANKLLVKVHLEAGDFDSASNRLDLYSLLNAGDPSIEELREEIARARKQQAAAAPPPPPPVPAPPLEGLDPVGTQLMSAEELMAAAQLPVTPSKPPETESAVAPGHGAGAPPAVPPLPPTPEDSPLADVVPELPLAQEQAPAEPSESPAVEVEATLLDGGSLGDAVIEPLLEVEALTEEPVADIPLPPEPEISRSPSAAAADPFQDDVISPEASGPQDGAGTLEEIDESAALANPFADLEGSPSPAAVVSPVETVGEAGGGEANPSGDIFGLEEPPSVQAPPSPQIQALGEDIESPSSASAEPAVEAEVEPSPQIAENMADAVSEVAPVELPTPSEPPPAASSIPAAALTTVGEPSAASSQSSEPGDAAGAESEDADSATPTLGFLYLDQGHYQEAQKIFAQVIEKDPTNAQALDGLSRVAELKAKKADALVTSAVEALDGNMLHLDGPKEQPAAVAESGGVAAEAASSTAPPQSLGEPLPAHEIPAEEVPEGASDSEALRVDSAEQRTRGQEGTGLTLTAEELLKDESLPPGAGLTQRKEKLLERYLAHLRGSASQGD